MKNADYIIDIGPDGGSSGGEIVFQGTVKDMVENSSTITAKYIRKSM
jgi:excinuclease UvrABC ATPase subunit